jgi:hypothetical protein
MYRFMKFTDSEGKDRWIEASSVTQVEDASSSFPQPTTSLHFDNGDRIFVLGTVEEISRRLDEW